MEKLKLTGLWHLFVCVFLYSFTTFMVIPAITDVTVAVTCPGRDECSLAIYLVGFQQAIGGLGLAILTPLMGKLSDKYGRKTLLTIPMTATVVPLATIAYSRETNFFYAYFVLRTLANMVGEHCLMCLALAYVADHIPKMQRASAFVILSGMVSLAFVGGTLATRFLSATLTFQVAAVVSVASVVYMSIFLQESVPEADSCTQPILEKGPEVDETNDSPKKLEVLKKIPAAGDLICLLRSSLTFSQAAVVAFFYNLAEGASQACLLYFLKARFHFNKNEFADLMIIGGITAALSQLVIIPYLAPIVREEKLLSVGLLIGCSNMFLYSISWSAWVPYVATIFSNLSVFIYACIRSIASKQVGPLEQGKAQGYIVGISSFANIIAPLAFSPLTALFLSEDAPFYFPGFSLTCIAGVMTIALIQSLMIKAAPPNMNEECCSDGEIEGRDVNRLVAYI